MVIDQLWLLLLWLWLVSSPAATLHWPSFSDGIDVPMVMASLMKKMTTQDLMKCLDGSLMVASVVC